MSDDDKWAITLAIALAALALSFVNLVRADTCYTTVNAYTGHKHTKCDSGKYSHTTRNQVSGNETTVDSDGNVTYEKAPLTFDDEQ